jgi:Tfp pilus assembly protein PilF
MCVLVLSAALVDPARAQTVQDAGSTGADFVARARIELARPDRTEADLERVAGWLAESVAAAPASFEAHALMGEVALRQGRARDAVAIYARACSLAHGAAQVFPCSLDLAEARAQAGLYAEALKEYARHVEVGNPAVVPWVLVRSGELHMALGRLSEAEVDFDRALDRLTRPSRQEQTSVPSDSRPLVVRAMLGKSVAQDRAGRDRDARQTMWRALALDPQQGALDQRGDGARRPLVPDGEVLYYRGLADMVLGESAAALAAFEAYRTRPTSSPWRKRAEDHLLALAAQGAELPLQKPRHGRVVAMATLRSKGPIPAPMIDAVWRSRQRLLDVCLGELPAETPRILRVAVLLDIDGRGKVRRATVALGDDAGFGLPEAWRPVTDCVEKRVENGLRLPRPTNVRRTSARVELVLAIDRQP